MRVHDSALVTINNINKNITHTHNIHMINKGIIHLSQNATRV